LNVLTNLDCKHHVQGIVPDEARDGFSHIWNFGQFN